jgi:hypothetical protein
VKVAVCISGQPRHFKKGHHFFEKAFAGMDVDYFIHSWYDESSVGEELVPGSNPVYHSTGWHVEEDTDKGLITLYNPKRYVFEKQIKFVPRMDFSSNMKTKQKPENFMSMVYSRKEVGKLLEGYVQETGKKYDWVFFTRTDVAVMRSIEGEIKNLPNSMILTAHVPGEGWNVIFNNDPFVGGNYETMIYWSKLYDYYETHWLSGIPFCAHRLQHHHLKMLNLPFKHILEPQGEGWGWIRNEGIVCY